MKDSINNTNEVSMKEIELRITSVLKDFDETYNPKKKSDNKAALAKEKVNFVPTLVGKFNSYKYMNTNSRNNKRTSGLSFLKGISKKRSTNTTTKTTVNTTRKSPTPDPIVKNSSDKLGFNNLPNEAKENKEQKPVEEYKRRMTTIRLAEGKNPNIKGEVGGNISIINSI